MPTSILEILKLKAICITCFFLFQCALPATAQVVWQENFNYSNGTTTGANNNAANPAADWTSQCPSCLSGDWFEVRSDRMEGLDVNGPATLETEWIDISAFPQGVEVLVDLEEDGSMEGCPGGASSGCNSVDWIRIEYRVDGDPYADWTSPNGGPCSGACAGATYVTYGNFPAFTFKECPVTGDSLRLRISVQCWATNETLSLDNIIVQAQACVFDPPSDSLVHVQCNGGADGEIWVFSQNPNLPLTYSLNGGPFQSSNSFSGLAAGIYFVTVMDGTGGTEALTGLVLSEPSPMNLSITAQSADCNVNNGSATAMVSGGNSPYSYTWNTVPPQFSANATGLSGGTYGVTVTDSADCTISDNVTILQPPGPNVDLGNDTLVCEMDSLVLDAGNLGTSFLWSNGGTSQTTSVFASGTYWVEVTDLMGCTGVDTLEIGFTTTPVINLGADTLLCDQSNFGLDADPLNQYTGATFDWSNGEINSDILVSSSGAYSVRVEYGVGCIAMDTVQIAFSATPKVELGPDTMVCANTEFYLDADPTDLYSNATIAWTNLETTPQILVETSGIYKVTIQNECGTASDSIAVDLHEQSSNVFIPNAFTPNQDGLNDVFAPVVANIDEYHLAIFDRWGKMVFESRNPAAGWDGTFNGVALSEGIFVYVVRARDCFGELGARRGSVVLLR